MASFTLDRLQFSYEADFLPPVLEIVAAGHQIPFLKMLLRELGLKIGDITLSQQNVSRNLYSFLKWFPNGGSCNVSIGAGRPES